MRMMGKTRKAEAIPAPFADDETTEAVEQAKAASNANKAKLEATAEKAKERQAINDLIQSGKNRGHKESLRERRHSLSNEGSAVVTTASTSTSPATSFSGSSPATSFTTSEADVINKLMAASNIKPSAMKERHRTVSAPSPNAIETNEINKLIAASKTNPSAMKERRRTVSDALPHPNADDRKRPAPMAKQKAASPTATPKSSPRAPKKNVPAAKSAELKKGSVALSRWKNASVALSAVAADDDEEDDGESNQAKLYKLLSQTTEQHLTGAAARGAQAAAHSRVRAASLAVGGKFLTEGEWHLMKSEVAILREANKRIVAERDGNMAAMW